MQEAVELNIYTGDNNEFMLILSSCKNASVAEKWMLLK